MGCDIYANLENLFSSISTHTSRVGCDCMHPHKRKEESNFYSHIPCGMWPKSGFAPNVIAAFLLTHPVWDVTNNTGRVRKESQISTHTSRVGCDRSANGFKITNLNFYSHIPCGMWLDTIYRTVTSWAISTHTSRVGCDLGTVKLSISLTNFYSHIPCGMWHLFLF